MGEAAAEACRCPLEGILLLFWWGGGGLLNSLSNLGTLSISEAGEREERNLFVDCSSSSPSCGVK